MFNCRAVNVDASQCCWVLNVLMHIHSCSAYINVAEYERLILRHGRMAFLVSSMGEVTELQPCKVNMFYYWVHKCHFLKSFESTVFYLFFIIISTLTLHISVSVCTNK